MTLNYETLDIADSGGQFLSTYTADVGSPSEERLRILMSRGGDVGGEAGPADSAAARRPTTQDKGASTG